MHGTSESLSGGGGAAPLGARKRNQTTTADGPPSESLAKKAVHAVEATYLSFQRPLLSLVQQSLHPHFELPAHVVHFAIRQEFIALAGPSVVWLYSYSAGAEISILLVTTETINGVLKWAFRQPRPGWLRGTNMLKMRSPTWEADYSTPSSHAQLAATVATWVVLFTNFSVIPSILAILFAVLVGVARVYSCVHWPSDVVFGWACGVLWTAFVLPILRSSMTPSHEAGFATVLVAVLSALLYLVRTAAKEEEAHVRAEWKAAALAGYDVDKHSKAEVLKAVQKWGRGPRLFYTYAGPLSATYGSLIGRAILHFYFEIRRHDDDVSASASDAASFADFVTRQHSVPVRLLVGIAGLVPCLAFAHGLPVLLRAQPKGLLDGACVFAGFAAVGIWVLAGCQIVFDRGMTW
ncbi:PAP2 superfamily-domain-containing protein [Fimicolochytrium jonesii]|uniref:PAP2 superfamily-domain-containing protein n=1 Tax=Fimicolochytrium jonesii TaxID=1396493 RepID=UPI0022FF41EB|nr:PAP2 superfamily-domain-containing protein [Fimicolochytrium jonesii]KAI8826659.1 PAP2 superfamily-domain-containing protein [Fimicolochytrium jonesii]